MKIDLTSKKSHFSSADDALNNMLGGGYAVAVEPKGSAVELDLDCLVDYKGQPFKPYSQEKLLELAEDIKVNGIISPIIVRKTELGKYQILAGHNRRYAAQLIGLTKVPCIIKEVDDKQAQNIMLSTNLCQREQLLPSEKAFAYKMLLDVAEESSLSLDDIAKTFNEQKRNMYRYVRLTYLIDDFLEQVDNGTLSFISAVNISYLSPDEQDVLYCFVADNKKKISVKQSEMLKSAFSLSGKLTSNLLDEIFFPKKKKKNELTLKVSNYQLAIIKESISKRVSELSPEIYSQIMELLEKAVVIDIEE